LIESRTRWAVQVASLGDMGYVYKILVDKPEGKRPLGRPRSGWEDNIRINLKEK